MEITAAGGFLTAVLYVVPESFIMHPITGEIVVGLIVLLLLLCGSALSSGSEIAYFSLTKSHIQTLRETKAHAVLHLLEKPRLLLATVLIANNFFNVSIVILSYFMLTELFTLSNALIQFLLEVVLVTFIIVLFGEVIPKVYSNYNSLSVAKWSARPVLLMQRIFKPLAMALVTSTRFLEKRMVRHKKRMASKDEIGAAIDIAGHEESTHEERNILKGIVRFGDITVHQIMCPRTEIVAVEQREKFKTVFNTFIDSGFSRIPVFEETLDNIAGILYAKDMLSHVNESNDFNWPDLIRPPFFVPENKRIEDLLREFQKRHIHLAIAVDEYGGTAGVVTLEDIMEEIIGDIKDEFDHRVEMEYEQVGPRAFVFEGKVLIHDFCKVLGLPNDFFDNVRGEADSLAGLLLEIFEKIPKDNESITYNNYQFEVLSVTRKRIKKVKVTIPADEES